MRRRRLGGSSLLFLIILGLTAGAGTLAAQQAGLSEARRLVTLELTLPGGQVAEVTTWEGEAARLTLAGGDTLAFVPRVTGAAAGEVTVSVFRLSQPGDLVQSIEAVQEIVGQIGFPAFVGAYPVEFEISEVRRATPEDLRRRDVQARSKYANPDASLEFESTDCCVGCGRFVLCGCAVSAGCGSCCGGCCGDPAK